ncbi:hypothetical protein [Anditalea andensis]|uniref:RiboL-PSP-HEPN domain-containing protein n=1 Tax=Anditalea andensis TaxID=1048983 RepID=A0A074KVR5_9BACT|nr:hypothetical protein [Anditalea andensis]KEO71668.1 hypothetical protein EL17_23450 [Anditalea andensis]
MKKEAKKKAIEHIGLGIAKIVNNYSEYALLINACDLAAKRYADKKDTSHLSTTQNIPYELRLDNEIEVRYSNENLVKTYKEEVLNKVLENYLIASISVVDGILEDLYEILLKYNEPELSDEDIGRRVNSSWRNDSLLNYLIHPDGANLKEPKGFNMKYRETFLRYYELRIIRHAIIHTSSVITETDYSRLEKFAEETVDERKNIALVNSPLINKNKKINLSINSILSIRQYLDRFLMYFYKSVAQEEEE